MDAHVRQVTPGSSGDARSNVQSVYQRSPSPAKRSQSVGARSKSRSPLRPRLGASRKGSPQTAEGSSAGAQVLGKLRQELHRRHIVGVDFMRMGDRGRCTALRLRLLPWKPHSLLPSL